MGQKTHPLGFRLGITQDDKSKWYSNFNQYTNILKEDHKIRNYIETFAKRNRISNVEINRNGLNSQIQLNIETAKPNILIYDYDNHGAGIEILLSNIKKLLPKNRQLTINVSEVENSDLKASLLANRIVDQLEKRIAFRKAIREALQVAQNQNVNGIKIQVSGRLNGAEIARSEWVREGRVPLQTLGADIEYAAAEANTIYGVLGIKVWLFKNELLS